MPKEGKPRGRMTSYAFFVQTCREEHKKKHPGESVVFAEFSRKCSEKWKAMQPKEKKRFEDMAEKDRARYDLETRGTDSAPGRGGGGGGRGGKRKRTKDPNAPKRSLSGFFFFCHEERPKVKAVYPSYGVGDIAKELGKRWEVCPNRAKFEAMAAKDKLRYEQAMSAYKAAGGDLWSSPGAPKVPKTAAPVSSAAVANDDEGDDDEDDEEDDESE